MNVLARRLLLSLAVAAPFLTCWLFLHTYTLPAHVTPHVLNLSGTWKAREGDEPAWAAPAYNDTGWRDLRLPGAYGAQRHLAWARKRFELPAALQGQPLLFTLGGLRAGRATVYLNGHELGRTEELARGPKAELEGLDAWEVDPRSLHPGENVLALRFEWAVPGDDGLVDARMLLGAREHLRPYYLRESDTRHFFQSGALLLFVFMLVVLGTFLGQEAEPVRRALQRATFALVASAALYVAVLSGLFPFLPQHAPATYTAILVSAAVFAWACVEFVEQYCLERVTPARRLHRVICGGSIVTFLGAYVLDRMSWSATGYQLFALYLFSSLLYLAVLTARTLVRRRRPEDGVVAAALACILGAGAADLLTDLYVIQAPRLVVVSIANLGLCAGALLIADFIQLSYVNKSLSARLARTNAELAVALTRAEEVARLKGELLANVSHELRTPLNAIINLPEGLLASFVEQPVIRCRSCGAGFELEVGESVGPDTACPSCGAGGGLEAARLSRFEGELADIPRHLRTIHRNGTHLLRLINDVLDFSQLESGRWTPRLQTVVLSQVWSELREVLSPLARAQQLTLRLAPVDPSVSLRADPLKLAQILVNLLGNAIKFSSPGGVVELTVVEEGDSLVFCVRDQGIGIAPEHHQLIFESFRQVDGSHTRKFGGSGLGLSITRKLVELHQGSLWLDSAPGQGSAFFVRLPRGGPVDRAPAVSTPLEPQARSAP